jgi:hypothetical protein
MYFKHVQSASTFAELYAGYKTIWPHANADTDRLLSLAQTIAAEYPDVDFWYQLDRCLRHTMGGFDPTKGPFERLFVRNWRERLRKLTLREAKKLAQQRRREREAAKIRAEALRRPDHVESAYTQWSRRLLDLASERLDSQTRTYLEMKRAGIPVKNIASMLGVTAKTLWNKLGGNKLANRVRREVRQLVLELPPQHRQLLERHLLEEAGFTPNDVERLLGVRLMSPCIGPILDEEALLKILVVSCDYCRLSGDSPQLLHWSKLV